MAVAAVSRLVARMLPEVGEEGQAMLHMMRNLELERLTLAAMSLGIARRSLEIMNRYG